MARIDWSKVDFSRPIADIVSELGCSIQAVYNAKKKLADKSAAQGLPDSPSIGETSAPTKTGKKVATKKDSATIGFEKQIWDAACVLWGHIPAADYRKVIVGLIFLRYVSSAFDRRYNELVAEGYGDENDRDAYVMENIFFIPEEARWPAIASAAHTPEIGTVLDNAMRAIEKENPKLRNVLPKIYGNPDIDKKVLGDVVDIFTNNIHLDDSDEGKDLLGRTYEYCIAQFASYDGTTGGEFYTPASIVKTIVAVLKPFDNCRVYDPCCGSGGMFVQSADFVRAHGGLRKGLSVYAQESNSDTWKMAKMNMAIRGINADFGEHHADTFTSDLHPTLKAHFIMANPPFNYHPWHQEQLKEDVRWKYGLPPENNANFAWIQHMIHHMDPTRGRIGLVLANGALSSQTGGEGLIRRKIIEADLVEAIVALPDKLFYSVQIPVTLWFFAQNKEQTGKTLFIDARKLGFMVDRKHRDFSADDIARIADTVDAFRAGTLQEEKGFCAIADLEAIAAQDHILTPGRYVGIEEQEDDGEPFDEKMKRLTAELADLFAESDRLQEEIRKNLKAVGYEL
ncbi:MAG: type I restriction-modification system subunit M [Mailhella sp.]|nr:type I restriction-modification system subunit M [Mailhella sp.]